MSRSLASTTGVAAAAVPAFCTGCVLQGCIPHDPSMPCSHPATPLPSHSTHRGEEAPILPRLHSAGRGRGDWGGDVEGEVVTVKRFCPHLITEGQANRRYQTYEPAASALHTHKHTHTHIRTHTPIHAQAHTRTHIHQQSKREMVEGRRANKRGRERGERERETEREGARERGGGKRGEAGLQVGPVNSQ